MKVTVGSQNQTKVAAVEEIVALYSDTFVDAEVEGVDVSVEEFGHPKSVEAIVSGAVKRAKKAFGDGVDYSFGIESGLMAVPLTRSGYMEIHACVIYDGKNLATGLSTGFEWPTGVTEKILEGNFDGSASFRELGYTEEEKLGNVTGGIIGVLTDSRMTRERQVRDSIMMAMIQIEKREWYN